MTARREYTLALTALAVSGLGVIAAYGMTWASAQVPLLSGAAGSGRTIDLSGAELAPVGVAGGWLAAAAVAGLVATRGVGRRIVAALAALGGLAGIVGAVGFALRSTSAVTAAQAAATQASVTLAWALAAAAAAVVVAASGWVFVRGGRWPSLGARYERTREDRSMSAWDAQDLGLDPTADDRLVE